MSVCALILKSTQQQHLPQHLDACLPFFCRYTQRPSTFSSMSLCYLDEVRQDCHHSQEVSQWGCVTFDKLIMLHHVVCNSNRLASNDLHYLGVKANMILPSVGAPCPAVCLYQVIRLLGPQEGASHNSALYPVPPLSLSSAQDVRQ